MQAEITIWEKCCYSLLHHYMNVWKLLTLIDFVSLNLHWQHPGQVHIFTGISIDSDTIVHRYLPI